MSLNLTLYWMGRDSKYRGDLTLAIRANAADLLDRVNRLVGGAKLILPDSGALYSPVHSGWRPPVINAATPHASPHSHHMTGQAIDLHDPHGDLDSWCLAHPDSLAAVGLWQESPESTPGWCHLQSVAPASGHRVFIP